MGPTALGLQLVGTLQGINNFCREIGITRTGGELPLHILDFHVRGDLHLTSPRSLAVLHPLRVVITNLAEDHFEMMDAKASSCRQHPPTASCSASVAAGPVLCMRELAQQVLSCRENDPKAVPSALCVMYMPDGILCTVIAGLQPAASCMLAGQQMLRMTAKKLVDC